MEELTASEQLPLFQRVQFPCLITAVVSLEESASNWSGTTLKMASLSSTAFGAHCWLGARGIRELRSCVCA